MYINIETGEYPITEEEMKAQNTHWCFPIPFEPCTGYAAVKQTNPPEFNPTTHKAVLVPPSNKGAEWIQEWEVVPLSPDEIGQLQQETLEAVRAEAQRRLDEFAQERRYDGIVSLASYATSKVDAYRKEGQYGVDMRDDFWDTLRSIEDAVLAGKRPLPTYEEAIAELPDLNWASMPV